MALRTTNIALTSAGAALASVANGATYYMGVPANVDRPTALVSVEISNTATTPTVTYKLQGSLDGTVWHDIDKADHSTAASWASGGANVSTYDYVELFPYMRAAMTNATSTGAGYSVAINVFGDVRFSS